jgi:tetratricopeptide (TPR) repeat protein
VLAFLLASFPARNSDLWMHLATGRALVHGQYHFGADPFAQNTADVYWVNHAWLFDLIAYALYTLLGGAGLVVLKAVLTAVLAGVLVLAGRAGRGLWAAAVCAALAVLATGPWLQLQPVGLSYLFLALTLFVLERPRLRARAAGRPAPPWEYWPLPVLFALWVNLDAWFLLGPLTLALYTVGQGLQQWVGPGRDDPAVRRGEVGRLGLALAAGLAACLLNPHGVFAFAALPSQLAVSPAALVLRPEFKGLALSPFQADYFRPSLGGNPAGLAYFLLAALSAASFAVNFGGWRWRRGLVWLALFALSAAEARAIPFFAVAAGPFLALNGQEFLARLRSAPAWAASAARGWAAAGRVVTGLTAAALAVAAWPGWLQVPPYEPRRWSAEPNPSLARAAERLAAWRSAGVLGPDDHAFTTSVDAANQLAWLCPDEKGFLDTRLTPFPARSAADYLAVRRALAGGGSGDWREVLSRNKISIIVLNEAERAPRLAWARSLFGDPDEWVPLYQDGGTAVFGWEGAAAWWSRVLDEQAYHPDADRRAPPEGPGDPAPAGWFDAFLRARGPAADRDEADLDLLHFEAELPRQAARNNAPFDARLAAALWGSPVSGDFAGAVPYALWMRAAKASVKDAAPDSWESMALAARKDFLRRRDDAPPGLLLLAVRAGRRAVRADPGDAVAWLALGEAYLRLSQNTRERVWYVQLPPALTADAADPRDQFVAAPLLGDIRRDQAMAALHRALLLNPNLDPAHAALADYYLGQGCLDLALRHFQEHLRCARAAGPRPGESGEAFAARLADLEEKLKKLDGEVARLSNLLEVNTANYSVPDRARWAVTHGLPDRALALLMDSDVSVFGRQGARLELDLLLLTGQLRLFRDGLEPDKPDKQELFGPSLFHRFRVRLWAAAGDYARADADLEGLTAPSRLPLWAGREGTDVTAREATALAVAEAVRVGQPHGDPLATLLPAYFHWGFFQERLGLLVPLIQEQADYEAVRGVLALEAGDDGLAEACFRRALAASGGESGVRSGAGVDFSGRAAAEGWLELMTARGR